jgi:hypothetical protein
MKGRKTWQRGYAAGLIDGEGCIAIRKINDKRRNNLSYQLQISVTQVDGCIVDWLFGVFGGKVYTKKAIYPRQNYYRWELTSKKAMCFLKQILPFLTAKKPQAEIGIRFEVSRKIAINQFKPQKPEDLKRYEWYFQEIRRLKHEYTPCAVATTNRTDSRNNVGSDSLVLQEK